jgi:hypothetical protein
MRSLAKGAFPPGTELRELVALGVVIGKAEIRLYGSGVDRGQTAAHAAADACLAGLVRAATVLLDRYGNDVPVLEAAAHLGPSMRASGSGDLLFSILLPPKKKVLTVEAKYSTLEVRYRNQIIELDLRLQEGLLEVIPPAGCNVLVRTPPAPPAQTPGAMETCLTQPGYLGVTLVKESGEVWREGYASPVCLNPGSVPWSLLKTLWQGGEVWISRDDLNRQVWASNDAEPEPSTIYWTISKLRADLAPVKVGIANRRGQGYRLEDLAK